MLGHYCGYLLRRSDLDSCPLAITTAYDCGQFIPNDPNAYVIVADPASPPAQINDPGGTKKDSNLITEIMSRGFNQTKNKVTPYVLRLRALKAIKKGMIENVEYHDSR